MITNTAFLQNPEIVNLSREDLKNLIQEKTLSWVKGKFHSYGNLYLVSSSEQKLALICLVTFQARIKPEGAFIMKTISNKFQSLAEAVAFVSKEISERGYLVGEFND
jgi:hypothetical protein